jgi:hypothetical protein
MAFRKSRRLRRNLRKSRKYKGGYVTSYIINKYRENKYSTPYTIAAGLLWAETEGKRVLDVNDWRELHDRHPMVYKELAKLTNPQY